MDTRMWEAVQTILRELAERDATAAATCGSLVALLCDTHIPQAVEGVLTVLSRVFPIKFPPVTSGVSVEAKLLDRILDMLEDSSTAESHQLYILRIISNLVFYESTAVAFVEANILNFVHKLLRSCPTDLHQHIFRVLENLVFHESTAMAVVRMLPLDLLGILWGKSFEDTTPIDDLKMRWEDLVTTKLLEAPCQATAKVTCSSLVALVCDSDIPQVVDGALWLLSCAPHIKFPLVTTGVSIESQLLTRIADMLEAPNTPKLRHPVIFQILSHLAFHESTAVAIVEANILNSMENHLRCRSTDLYKYIFPMLESLVSRKSTATAVLDMHLYDLLATLWR
ncbi:hypothetical protein C8J57DRAFT_228222 [Mycena rebaudengoi]|nr:hypothetical protein C8J57DRAFT_228222 [Mycena rebaudengoi]